MPAPHRSYGSSRSPCTEKSRDDDVSIQPVLDAKASNTGKVSGIPREQRGIVGDANSAIFKSIVPVRRCCVCKRWKDFRRIAVKRQEGEFAQCFDAGLKAGVAFNLVGPGPVLSDESNPAVERFLGYDNAGENVGVALIDSAREPFSGSGVLSEFTKVIRVKDDEHALLSGALAPAPLFAESSRFPVNLVSLGGSNDFPPSLFGHGLQPLLKPLHAGGEFSQLLLDGLAAHGLNVPANNLPCKRRVCLPPTG